MTDADTGTTTDAAGNFVAQQGPGELAERMGIEFLELTVERSVARMPVLGNRQSVGFVHGGAYVVLGESLGSVAANLHAGPGRLAVGVDVNATHTRSATSGHVHAVCTPLHLGRTVAVHEIVITDDEGRRCSTVRITNHIKDMPAHASA
ncbi:hotdog fold thioesterase [Microbacterium sp. MEC084]|uniref:PaaI family thioesterase n=1 Tax=unclassified Microbacterium TaxID=2609290 RepID=UPI0006F5A251|nr:MULTISPECIES: hotdog fold thioesterase [unclassified Microbacterium]KQY99204.1 thioesterase [Microbacterium sp. Root53]MCD1269155.1 hotdog fold thioesterase [Microbacterium sp. MEC084]